MLKGSKGKSLTENNLSKGLIIVFTGEGKGKTTASLGLALRAAGHGMRILILQFIKGALKTGEIKAIEKLRPFVEIEQLGRGFIKYKDGKPVITEADRNNAVKSFRYACDKIMSGLYDIIILDEINNLVDYKLLDISSLVNIIKNKPSTLSIILTGRNAPADLIDIADIVTEMKEIKHCYGIGIKAKRGIEY